MLVPFKDGSVLEVVEVGGSTGICQRPSVLQKVLIAGSMAFIWPLYKMYIYIYVCVCGKDTGQQHVHK